MTWLLIIISTVLLLFGAVVFLGAPYLPTRRQQAEAALDLLSLKPGDRLLELGCGDGKVLLLAAQRGLKVTGYELNPILAAVARLRTWRYRDIVDVVWADYWQAKWPDSDGVFVFLIEKFMPKLEKRMIKHGGPLASVAFQIPNRPVSAQKDGVFLYSFL